MYGYSKTRSRSNVWIKHTNTEEYINVKDLTFGCKFWVYSLRMTLFGWFWWYTWPTENGVQNVPRISDRLLGYYKEGYWQKQTRVQTKQQRRRNKSATVSLMLACRQFVTERYIYFLIFLNEPRWYWTCVCVHNWVPYRSAESRLTKKVLAPFVTNAELWGPMGSDCVSDFTQSLRRVLSLYSLLISHGSIMFVLSQIKM